MFQSFKTVKKINDKECIISHDVKSEYNSHDFAASYTYDKFKNDVLNNYIIGKKLKLCWNIIDDENVIHLNMKYYNRFLINDVLYQDRPDFAEKLIQMLEFLNENNIFHDDIAFRNIAIDEFDNLKLIDLSSLRGYKIDVNNLNCELCYLFYDLKSKYKNDVIDKIINYVTNN